jgi:RNA polymerase sigma-70 factor (ECF subfamily)
MAEMRADELLARWRAGDQSAATELFRRYAARLVALAEKRLPAKLARIVDAEDVVQSAYRSFFADAREGHFELSNGADLWQLLATITLHKVYRKVRSHSTQKRSLQREQAFGSEDSLHGLQENLATNGSPLDIVMLADELENFLSTLKPMQRHILELRLQGHTVEEIATRVQRSERLVYFVLDELKQLLGDSSLTSLS